MPNKCRVPCKNRQDSRNKEISWCRFLADTEIRLKRMQLLNITKNVTKSSRVCSAHFKPEDFLSNGQRRYLRKNAIPNEPPVPREAQVSIFRIYFGRRKYEQTLLKD